MRENLWPWKNPWAGRVYNKPLGRSGFFDETKLRFRHAPLIIQNTNTTFQITKYKIESTKYKGFGILGFLGKMKLRIRQRVVTAESQVLSFKSDRNADDNFL